MHHEHAWQHGTLACHRSSTAKTSIDVFCSAKQKVDVQIWIRSILIHFLIVKMPLHNATLVLRSNLDLRLESLIVVLYDCSIFVAIVHTPIFSIELINSYLDKWMFPDLIYSRKSFIFRIVICSKITLEI